MAEVAAENASEAAAKQQAASAPQHDLTLFLSCELMDRGEGKTSLLAQGGALRIGIGVHSAQIGLLGI